MERNVDIPCQVCSITSTKGDVAPLWCRYRNEQGEICKLDIIEAKPTGPAQVICNMFFECTAAVDERKVAFILKLDGSSHRWAIIRILM